MAYGLRIKDAVGNIILNITDRISRLRYSTSVAADASGNSGALTDIDGLLTVEFGVPINLTLPNRVEHVVSRTGTTISWSPNGDASVYFSQASIIFAFLYT